MVGRGVTVVIMIVSNYVTRGAAILQTLLRRVVGLALDAGTLLSRPLAGRSTTPTILHLGAENRLDDVRHYRSPANFRRGFAEVKAPGPHAYLLQQSFVDDAFLSETRPKLFFTKEPPQLMTAETVEAMHSGVIERFAYRYDDPVPSRRMYFPALTRKTPQIVRGLESALGRTRPGLCCIVNRYSNNPALELAAERTRFARAFGPDIDIYGRSPWEGPDGWRSFPNYFGPTNAKLETLSNYAFVIAFENTDYHGYISEKIFDAFLAGAIPLYWGGGRLLKGTIPEESFIDCSGSDPREIVDRIKGMRRDEIVRFREAGLRFLRSRQATLFTWGYFADGVLSRFEEQVEATS
jgi:hypothetical protein